MQHIVWRPNSRQRPAVEAICGLLVEFEEKAKGGEVFQDGTHKVGPCPECYGPSPEIHGYKKPSDER